MSKILRRLHEDHANLWRILAILEHQIAVMDRGDRPDLDIVQGSIEYFLTYPDLRHHPLENRVLMRLQAKDPGAAEPFTGLEAEHREQSETLRHIAAVTFQVLQDTAMARQGYVGMLRSFVIAQRDHVRREEESFFPAAERAFSMKQTGRSSTRRSRRWWIPYLTTGRSGASAPCAMSWHTWTPPIQ